MDKKFVVKILKLMMEYFNTSELIDMLNDIKNFKLMMVPGIKGLSRYGRKMTKDAFEIGSNQTDIINRIRHVGVNAMDWSATGILQDATGNAGVKTVYDLLVNNYGIP